MSKNKNNDYALVSVLGTVVFSDARYYEDKKEIKKELHNYFIQVIEKYNDKKYYFKAVQFDLKRNSFIYKKGDRVKISGFLKVNSYKNDEGEWINEPYICINKIENAE